MIATSIFAAVLLAVVGSLVLVGQASRHKSGPKKGQFKKGGGRSPAKRKGGGRRASSGGGRRRAKKSPMMSVLAATGIWPVAPLRAARVFGRLNIGSSVFLGKDLANGFKGESGATTASLVSGETRIDVIDFWNHPNRKAMNLGPRLGVTLKVISNHIRGTFTGTGLARTVGPAIAGEVLFQGGKALKLNQSLPAELRKWVKFT